MTGTSDTVSVMGHPIGDTAATAMASTHNAIRHLQRFTETHIDAALVKYQLLQPESPSQREVAKLLGISKSKVNRHARTPLLDCPSASSATEYTHLRSALLDSALPPNLPFNFLRECSLIYDAEHGIGTPRQFPGMTKNLALKQIRTLHRAKPGAPKDPGLLLHQLRLAHACARTLGATPDEIAAANPDP